jgi:hypothetical protein
MFGMFAKLWEGIKALPGLLLPFLAKARTPSSWSPWLRWTAHVVLLAAVLVGLGYLNWLFDLERVLRAPWPVLRKIWLPMLFFLVYLLGWLGWWLWQLLGSEEKTSAFPDIDAAWHEALQSLDRAGIDLTEAPLFLILGQPRGTEESLFAAAQLPLQVRHVPRRPGAPLHVYASREGIYVTCAGASLLGRLAGLLAEETAEEIADTEPMREMEPVGERRSKVGSLHWQSVPEPGEGAAVAVSPEVGEGLVAPPPVRKRRPPLLQSSGEVELCTARLRHVCHLITRARRPYCPVNGVLLLIPWSASDAEPEAQQTARACRHDLQVLREALHVQCPVFGLVCDLETVPGVSDLVSRLPPGQAGQRFGRGYPLVPELDATAVPDMLQSGVHWVCDTLFPSVVYKLFRYETPGADGPTDWLAANTRLYQLLGELRQRQQRLGAILARGVVAPDSSSTLFGGCYFAATGHDANHQAFVAGVFPLLTENQNFVRWTDEALAEEAAYRRWTVYGYAGFGLLTAVVATGFYLFWPGR